MKLHICLVAALVALFTSGCVVGRRTVDLSVPKAPSYPASKGEVSIVSVTDSRVFENKPADPSTPSIDGDVNTLTADSKDIMIGRQRNTYGKAMGDIGLPAGRGVTTIGKELLAEALKRKGYTVSSAPGAPVSVSLKIQQFWAWGTPGMWSISFEARLLCTMVVTRNSDGKTVAIKGYGINKGQVASDENWQQAYKLAFEDFLAKAAPELEQAGF